MPENLMCYFRILLHYIMHNKIMRTCHVTWKYTPLHYTIFFCRAVHRLILFRFPRNTTRTNWLGKHQLAITLSFLHRYGSCNKNDMIIGVVHWQCFSNSRAILLFTIFNSVFFMMVSKFSSLSRQGAG